MVLVSRAPFALASKAATWNPRRFLCRRGLATHNETLLPAEIQGQIANQDRYWQKIPQWRNTSTEDFLSYNWQVFSRPTQDNDPAHDEGEQYHPNTRSAGDLHALRLAPNDPACFFGNCPLFGFCPSNSAYRGCQRRCAKGAHVSPPDPSCPQPH